MTPFKPVFYFLYFFLRTSILPSAYCKAPCCLGRTPCCQPRPEHTLLLSWGAESKQTWNSEAPLAAPRPVPCLCLNIPLKIVHEKDLYIYSHPSCLTLPYFLFWVTQAVSITDGSFLLCFFPYGLESFTALHFPLKTIALHLKTFMLLALTNQRFLDISCSSGILLVAMVGSSPKRPIIAPIWKSVTWYGFY